LSIKIKFLLKLIFFYPGYIILWFKYFIPQKGKKGGFISVAESRRQFKEGTFIFSVFWSLVLWAFVALWIYLGWEEKQKPLREQAKIEELQEEVSKGNPESATELGIVIELPKLGHVIS